MKRILITIIMLGLSTALFADSRPTRTVVSQNSNSTDVSIPIYADLFIERCSSIGNGKICFAKSYRPITEILLRPVIQLQRKIPIGTDQPPLDSVEDKDPTVPPYYHYRGHGTIIGQGQNSQERLIGLITIDRYGMETLPPDDTEPTKPSDPEDSDWPDRMPSPWNYTTTASPPFTILNDTPTRSEDYTYQIQVEIIGQTGTQALMALSTNSLQFSTATLIAPILNNDSNYTSRAHLTVGPYVPNCPEPIPQPKPEGNRRPKMNRDECMPFPDQPAPHDQVGLVEFNGWNATKGGIWN